MLPAAGGPTTHKSYLTTSVSERAVLVTAGPREGVELCPGMKEQLRRAAGGDAAEPRKKKGLQPAEDEEMLYTIFVGDSLIAGVGCGEEQIGPALPRAVAQAVAGKSQRAVHWNALAIDGGDVTELHRELLPKLADVMAEIESSSSRGCQPNQDKISGR